MGKKNEEINIQVGAINTFEKLDCIIIEIDEYNKASFASDKQNYIHISREYTYNIQREHVAFINSTHRPYNKALSREKASIEKFRKILNKTSALRARAL